MRALTREQLVSAGRRPEATSSLPPCLRLTPSPHPLLLLLLLLQEATLLQLASECELTDRVLEMMPEPDVDKVKGDVAKLERKMRSRCGLRWWSGGWGLGRGA